MIKDFTEDTVCITYDDLKEEYSEYSCFIARKRVNSVNQCCGGNMAYLEVFAAADNETEIKELLRKLTEKGYSNISIVTC